MPATVTIRRELLDVELHGTEADGLALQRRLSDVCADVLGPALEAAFERVDPGDAHLVIEHLEIDLADISLDRLDAELADAVRREVAEYFRRNPVPSGPGLPSSEDGDVRRRTPAETVAIWYDSYRNLVAKGVIRTPMPRPHEPQPFPNAFVPDPPRR